MYTHTHTLHPTHTNIHTHGNKRRPVRFQSVAMWLSRMDKSREKDEPHECKGRCKSCLKGGPVWLGFFLECGRKRPQVYNVVKQYLFSIRNPDGSTYGAHNVITNVIVTGECSLKYSQIDYYYARSLVTTLLLLVVYYTWDVIGYGTREVYSLVLVTVLTFIQSSGQQGSSKE